MKSIVEKVCIETTLVANKEGINLKYQTMIEKTKDVIKQTASNYSSMLQSLQKHKQTEIDSINGRILEIGKRYNLELLMNEILVYSVKSIYK